MNLSKQIKELILNSITSRVEDSPFVKEDGETYVKFNSFKVKNEYGKGLKFVFMWNKAPVFSISCSDARIQDDSVVTVEGVEGKMPFTLD